MSNPHSSMISPITYTSDLKISIFSYPFKISGEYNLPYVTSKGSQAVALGSNTFTNELFMKILSVPSTP